MIMSDITQTINSTLMIHGRVVWVISDIIMFQVIILEPVHRGV